MKNLQEAVRRALADAPGSLRALAREAGVPHSTLVRIRQGDRTPTRDVSEALAAALERWSGSCAEAADTLRQSLSQEVDDE